MVGFLPAKRPPIFLRDAIFFSFSPGLLCSPAFCPAPGAAAYSYLSPPPAKISFSARAMSAAEVPPACASAASSSSS